MNIEELLGRGEQVLYEARQHVILLVSRVLTKMILIGILIATAIVSIEAFKHNKTPMIANFTASELIPALAGFISILLLISIFSDYLRWNAEQYIITDRRVIQIRGVLNKSTIDSSLGKINDIALTQNLFGRMFGYGTISILTAAEEGANTMEHIVDPLNFKRMMLEARHNYERGFGYLDSQATNTPLSASVGQSVPVQLDIQRTIQELATLRDRGILSIDEFEAKKRELLNRI